MPAKFISKKRLRNAGKMWRGQNIAGSKSEAPATRTRGRFTRLRFVLVVKERCCRMEERSSGTLKPGIEVIVVADPDELFEKFVRILKTL